MKKKKLTVKQRLFWAELQGCDAPLIAQYCSPEDCAVKISRELAQLNADEQAQLFDKCIGIIMKRFAPIHVTFISKVWFYNLSFSCLNSHNFDMFHKKVAARASLYITDPNSMWKPDWYIKIRKQQDNI